MTNPFQPISEPGGQKSFEEAVKAFTATERAEGDGSAEPVLLDDSEQPLRVETGLTDLRASTRVPYHVAPTAARQPLRGGVYMPAHALRILNAHFFIGKNHLETAVYRLNDDGSVTYVPPEQFKLEIQHVRVQINVGGATKLISAEKFWKENPDRHERVIVFKPAGMTEPHEFNLWRGFAVVPSKGSRKQRRLLRHIWKVLSRSDAKKFKYLIRYLAWAVQHPDEQAGVVIVLKSRKQGTGKSTLGVVMLMIFGPHGALIDDSDRLLGRFNDWVEPVSFILADEILWAGDHKGVDKLKSRITADTVQIERKNGAIRQIPNRLHMVMTTNHDHAIGAGVGDRRFVVYDISDEHANDRSWFDPLYRDLKDGGAGEFLYLLQNLKLKDWHPRQILKTAETVEQQRMSGDSVSQWAQACIEADGLIGGTSPRDLGMPISAETLRDAYNGFCKQSSQRQLSTETFGKACTDMFGPKQRPKALQKNTLGGKKQRPWGYHVPSGKKWQEGVDARLGIKN